jgi:hypothetical protein
VRGTESLQDQTQLDRYDTTWRNPLVPKNRDLFDYVSLGAQLVETANTCAIRDHLGHIARFEAEKLDAVQREAAAKERETKVRNFVFDSMKVIDAMKVEAVQDDPCRSLILFFELRRYVEKCGIATTAVHGFEDKERVHLFLTTLNALMEDCQARLDGDALDQAQQCEKFKAEGPELEQLIEFEATKARFEVLDSKLEELGPVCKRTVPVYVSASTIYVGFLGMVFAAIRRFDSNDHYVVISLTLSAIFFLVGLLMFWGKTLPNPEVLKVKSELEMESRVLNAITDGTAVEDWAAPLKQKFGESDVETYRKLAAERNEFVKRVMKREVK